MAKKKVKEESLVETFDQRLDVRKQRGKHSHQRQHHKKNILTPSVNVKTFETFMKRTIAKKNAPKQNEKLIYV
jgi:hypothetical protein